MASVSLEMSWSRPGAGPPTTATTRKASVAPTASTTARRSGRWAAGSASEVSHIK